MSINRRSLLKHSAAVPFAVMAPDLVQAADQQSNSEGADYTVRIATGVVELSPEHIVSTSARRQPRADAQAGRRPILRGRASMSLARFWRDQGKPQKAHELLAPVYGWFTEGFDTRDLKEAKALLDELAS